MGSADSATEDMRDVFELNVLAACVCTREAIGQMRERGTNGHVIIVNRYVHQGFGIIILNEPEYVFFV